VNDPASRHPRVLSAHGLLTGADRTVGASG